MNFNQISIFLFLALSLSIFTSCDREEVDDIVKQEDTVVRDSVNCNITGYIEYIADTLNIDTLNTDSTRGYYEALRVHASGGTEPYAYQWSTGATTETIDYTPGDVSVIVTDAAGCTFSIGNNSDTVFCALMITIDIDRDSVAEEMTITTLPIEGTGVAPYTYQWSTGETTSSVTVVPGVYAVTITDAEDCSVEANIETGDFTPDCDMYLELVGTYSDTMMFISTYTQGGVAPLTYQWSTGATTSYIDIPVNGQGQVVYTVEVTDGAGCVYRDTIEVDYDMLACDITVSVNAVVDGAEMYLNTSVEGGTAPYTYDWSDGSHESTLYIAADNRDSIYYNVVVTDVNGCSAYGEYFE